MAVDKTLLMPIAFIYATRSVCPDSALPNQPSALLACPPRRAAEACPNATSFRHSKPGQPIPRSHPQPEVADQQLRPVALAIIGPADRVAGFDLCHLEPGKDLPDLGHVIYRQDKPPFNGP
jgi:hypothetical protein